MGKAYFKKTIGIQSLTPDEQKYWKDRKVDFRPILEYKPLSKDEEQRLQTEYYDNNNRVGFEKLYYAVRQPNGKTKTPILVCFSVWWAES